MRPKPNQDMINLCSYYCELVVTNGVVQDHCGHATASKEIREHCKGLVVSDAQLKELMAKLDQQIKLGLDHKTREKSSVKCFNTYVQDLPSGREQGKFLALDLGGTNFRVLLIHLDKNHFDMQSQIYAIPQDVMIGPGTGLFDHIAECLANFTKQHQVATTKLPLGFTFSFPLEQKGITKGILQRWTKGFDCAGVVGKDVVELLKDAIKRRGDVQIEIYAILNDTTGTLMSCAWKNHNCRMGVILGTGTNACYVEEIKNIPNFDGDLKKPFVIVNTEWGAFGDNGELEFVRTPYDKEIDDNSINPGSQLHEKMISGMYLGEIVRLLLVKFTKDKLMFTGASANDIFQRGSFKTEYLSEIENEKRGSFATCRKVLEKAGVTGASEQDCSNTRYICEVVSRRAAHLASAGVATLINKMNVSSITVGVDGSLYRFHPHFHKLMCDKISQLNNSNIFHFDLMLSEDGSGRGAALVAASLEHPLHPSKNVS